MNVVARFLKILAFSLLCGIVGPIFIVMYYVIDEPATSWMLYSGVGITIGIVVLAFVLTLLFTKNEEARKLLEANGILALADVMAANETGMTVNDQPVIKLTLQVHGDGIGPFRAETRAGIGTAGADPLARKAGRTRSSWHRAISDRLAAQRIAQWTGAGQVHQLVPGA